MLKGPGISLKEIDYVWNNGLIIEKYKDCIYRGEEILGLKKTHNQDLSRTL
jgi:hypothetical protein